MPTNKALSIESIHEINFRLQPIQKEDEIIIFLKGKPNNFVSNHYKKGAILFSVLFNVNFSSFLYL